uniref:Uncharacterized protein n=1 Tax=Lygus hesperus TaxID=30085 RepID=A0A0A9XQ91_LYGHE
MGLLLQRMEAVLQLLLISVVTVECGLPFVYNSESAADPRKVALLREALTHAGVSPDGIILKSFLEKWEVFRTAYKATYINQLGQTCYLKWRVNDVIGTQTPKMPICENVATGTGFNTDSGFGIRGVGGSPGVGSPYGPPLVGPAIIAPPFRPPIGRPVVVGPPAVQPPSGPTYYPGPNGNIPGIKYGPPGIILVLPPGYRCPDGYQCPNGAISVQNEEHNEVTKNNTRKHREREHINVRIRHATTSKPTCYNNRCNYDNWKVKYPSCPSCTNPAPCLTCQYKQPIFRPTSRRNG